MVLAAALVLAWAQGHGVPGAAVLGMSGWGMSGWGTFDWAGPVSTDWPAVWRALEEVRGMAADAPAREASIDALREVAEDAGDAPGDPLRVRLLQAHVARLAGEEAILDYLHDPQSAWPFSGAENWLAAEVLADSPWRAQAARLALVEAPGLVDDDRLQLAWRVGVAEATALRLESAAALQRVLHERYRGAWSAMDLALTLSRLGDGEEADDVLADQIRQEAAAGRPTADLWARRGTQALGTGDERRARDYLGHALARGAANAGVVLAWIDLDRGRLPQARAGFRALLMEPEPSPWAARGWGLTLLPPPPKAPPTPTRTALDGE